MKNFIIQTMVNGQWVTGPGPGWASMFEAKLRLGKGRRLFVDSPIIPRVLYTGKSKQKIRQPMLNHDFWKGMEKYSGDYYASGCIPCPVGGR